MYSSTALSICQISPQIEAIDNQKPYSLKHDCWLWSLSHLYVLLLSFIHENMCLTFLFLLIGLAMLTAIWKRKFYIERSELWETKPGHFYTVFQFWNYIHLSLCKLFHWISLVLFFQFIIFENNFMWIARKI
jgi:hypothetical protein